MSRIRDVLECQAVALDSLSDDDLGALLKKQGLEPRFEWVAAGYLLWLPDERK
jgi:hypothetical protein